MDKTSSSDIAPETQTLFDELIRLPLQIASEIAARRDNRLNLHADMPCMLALMFTIANLADLAAEPEDSHQIDQAQLDDAANAACLMVLQRAELESDALADCMHALHRGLEETIRHGVLGPQASHCHEAWPLMQAGNTAAATQQIALAIQQGVTAIDRWIEQRSETTH